MRPSSAFQTTESKRGITDEKGSAYFQFFVPSKRSNFNFNDITNEGYRKKLIPINMVYKKEDLYD